MADPFIAEIKMFAGNFAPRGFAFCNGQLLPIAQNTALFSLLGTTYGGNGQSTFGLPNLMGRAPMHPGQGPGLSPRVLGETGGTATVALVAAELPPHSHTVTVAQASEATADRANAAGNILAKPSDSSYATGTTPTAMAPTTSAGTGQAHNNLQPYLVLSFIIAQQGIYPARN